MEARHVTYVKLLRQATQIWEEDENQPFKLDEKSNCQNRGHLHEFIISSFEVLVIVVKF